MTLKPAIALYLGETYAALGLFDLSEKKTARLLFEKTIFLPQISLKNLLLQTKNHMKEIGIDLTAEIPVYVVTKYFDRLKQFRLGGSISQVILAGFENSYVLSDTKLLSLAAPQLIISIDKSNIDVSTLEQEFSRIKKINPDLNKVVLALPEDQLAREQIEFLNTFFEQKGLKIFNCSAAHDQSFLRKTLLNAGSEGTKEEILSEIKESLTENAMIRFFCSGAFTNEYENCELFTSSTDFLSRYIEKLNYSCGTYLDFEVFKFFNTEEVPEWHSPWGRIPLNHRHHQDLSIHPYSELKLNQMSLLQFENPVLQLEPGPVVAGRAIKPLIVDLFYSDLIKNSFVQSLIPQISQENIKQKINNLFSVLEKGQKSPSLSIKMDELKTVIIETVINEALSCNTTNSAERHLFFGPLTDVFLPENKITDFSWPKEIIKMAIERQA